MKKKIGFAVLSITAFMFTIHSVSALTEYKYDGMQKVVMVLKLKLMKILLI